MNHHFLTRLLMGGTDGKDYGDLDEAERDDIKSPIAIRQ